MNKVILLGRLTRDVELKTGGANNTSFARFNIAVNRKFKNQDGIYEADFINCVSFGKNAENIAKFFTKGSQIGVTGRIQTGNYKDKDGKTVYTTDVMVDDFDFIEKKASKDESQAQTQVSKDSADEFMNMSSGLDAELPFA